MFKALTDRAMNLCLEHRKHCLTLPCENVSSNGGQVCIRARQRDPGHEFGVEKNNWCCNISIEKSQHRIVENH